MPGPSLFCVQTPGRGAGRVTTAGENRMKTSDVGKLPARGISVCEPASAGLPPRRASHRLRLSDAMTRFSLTTASHSKECLGALRRPLVEIDLLVAKFEFERNYPNAKVWCITDAGRRVQDKERKSSLSEHSAPAKSARRTSSVRRTIIRRTISNNAARRRLGRLCRSGVPEDRTAAVSTRHLFDFIDCEFFHYFPSNSC